MRLFSIAGTRDSAAGFSIHTFGLLAALIPIQSDDTPDRLRQRAIDARFLPSYDSLFREHNSDGQRLLDRLRALRLHTRPSDGCLVCTVDDDNDVLLLPTEAFGIVIDMVALEVFAGRERHRSLNAEVVLQEIKRTCLAGGRTFGSMRQKDIQARLSCSPLGSAAGKSDLSASLTAVLYRVAGDYDTVRALCNPSVAGGFLKSLPGLRPWPSLTEIASFAAGDLPQLVVPYCRSVLRALPDVNPESSCFAYDESSVLPADGTTKVEYRCARSAAAQASKKKGVGSGCAKGSATGPSEASPAANDDEPDDESAYVDDYAVSNEDEAADEGVSEGACDGAVSVEEPPEPPAVQRRRFSKSLAAAAEIAFEGLRSAHAPPTAAPTEPYVQDCNAGMSVYIPPRSLPGASMLLIRRRGPDGGAILRHCHRLDEHLPLADVLEQAILLEIKSKGTFSYGSAYCKHWLRDVLPKIGVY